MAEKVSRSKILVVDDDEAVGIGMRELLTDEGFEAAYVLSGADAVEAVRKDGYNLVFMDIIMPGMNGLEAFRKIRQVKPTARVVLITGFFRDAAEVIRQGVEEGMIDEFIRKPYFADEIIRTAAKYT